MRVLFLCHYFPPEVNAPANRTFEHCRAWARHGNDVSVMTCVPNHPAGRLYPGYRNGVVQKESVSGIQVYRLLTYLAPNSGVGRRSFNYFMYLVMAVLTAPFVPRTDVVVSTSPQFFCGLAGFFVSRIKRVPWVLEIRDMWPESIVAVGAMDKSAAVRALEWLADFAYRKADRIVCVTESFKKQIAERGIDPDKINVIRNGADLRLFSPEGLSSAAGTPASAGEAASGDQQALLHGLRDKFVVSYVGTHGMAHGLDTVLEAAELMKDDRDLVFLLVGDGAERERLLRKRDTMRLSNVVMLDQQPRERMPLIWAATNVSLVLLRDKPLFESVIPSKIFEGMAMAKPLILGVRGESQRLVEQAGAGVAIPPENAPKLAAAVRRLKCQPAVRAAMGRAGRRCAEEHFDRRKLADRFEHLLTGVAADRASLQKAPARH